MRAGGKRRFNPETLSVGGRRRELQGGGGSCNPHFCLPPSAPPCLPCICGSERGAGYCLKELAEFPVLLDGGGEAGEGRELRACLGRARPGSQCLGSANPPFFFSPTPWQGGVEDGGEADGVWELWICLSWGNRTPWAWKREGQAWWGVACPFFTTGAISLGAAEAQPESRACGAREGARPLDSGPLECKPHLSHWPCDL